VLARKAAATSSEARAEWCVDPLDAPPITPTAYPFFATSVGLSLAGVPLLGATRRRPRQCYWAAPGLGAWCNDERLQVSGCSDLAASPAGTGSPTTARAKPDTTKPVLLVHPTATRGVRRGGSAAVDLAFVAAGRLDGYWNAGLSAGTSRRCGAREQARPGGEPATDGMRLQAQRRAADRFGSRASPTLMAGLAQCRPLPAAC